MLDSTLYVLTYCTLQHYVPTLRNPWGAANSIFSVTLPLYFSRSVVPLTNYSFSVVKAEQSAISFKGLFFKTARRCLLPEYIFDGLAAKVDFRITI